MTQGDGAKKALRLHQSVARELGTAIITGKYKPGQSLGGEMEQSVAFHVSRTAYREAIRLLIAKGLIESRPKAGTFVAPRDRWSVLDPEILAWMFSAEPDKTFTRDLFELRRIIEPAAAELAAERREEADLARMRDALDLMRGAGLATQDGQAADRSFHRAILEATGNAALVSLAASVGAAVQWTTHFKHRARPEPRDPLPDHEAVLAAIEAGDRLAARDLMLRLVEQALADME